MKFLFALLLTATLAWAYAPPPDQLLLDGRIVHIASNPLRSYPWPQGHPALSEHPNPGVSDQREIAAIWEIRGDRLYLIAASAYRTEPDSPVAALGLRQLMPERVQDGRVLADWFTGELVVFETERVRSSDTLLPQPGVGSRFLFRSLRIEQGRVVSQGPQLTEAEWAAHLKQARATPSS